MVKLTDVLGGKNVLEILFALAEKPLRFSDLNIACPSEKTRAAKIRMLVDAGLIETEAMKRGKRSFIHYKLTEKGKRVLELAKEVNSTTKTSK